jgi:hypothetical protein
MGQMRSAALLLVIAAALAGASGANAAPPSNDSFSTPLELTGSGGSITSINIEATKELGEPNHGGDPGGASVWFTWTAPWSGVVLIDTCDVYELDTLLAVYTGITVASLTLVAENDDSCGERSAVELDVTAGTTYRIAVDGFGGTTGTFILSWEMPPANDDFADAEAIAGETGSVTGSTYLASHELGEPLHAGEPGRGSVWYRWTAPRNGRLRLNTCNAAGDTLLGAYTGSTVGTLTEAAAGDDGCGNGGLGSYLEFDAFTGTVYSIAVDSVEFYASSFTLQWQLGPLYPRNLSPPTLSGPAVENGVMTATPGAWLYASSFTFTWYHCPADALGVRTCTRIRASASDDKLTIPTSALGRHIRVNVTAHGEGAASAANSELSAAVGYAPPVNDQPPQISGIPEVGSTFNSSEGTWRVGTAPRHGIAYTWRRCDAAGASCSDVKGPGPDPIYMLTDADRGSSIRVVVNLTTAGGTGSATSHPSGVITTPSLPRTVRACAVPRVIGKTVARARAILRRSRCKFGLRVARRVRSARAAGVVVSQTPRAGRRLRSRGRVAVVVSRGRPR